MQDSFESLVGRVAGGEHLTREQMTAAINRVMTGEVADGQIGMLLTALAAKGETVDEIAGAAAAMRAHMTSIRSSHAKLLDTCGTGGGGSNTFNVSTTAALIAAAAGVPVAKHGNRSVTSKSGSADVLAALGVNIEASIAQVENCLDQLGICFCFAPLMHPSMKHVAAVRKKLGIRTIFNLLGPLANPAGASYQLLGVGRAELREPIAAALQILGTTKSLVVCGDDGAGDVTISGKTSATEVTADGLREFEWTPEDFGVDRGNLADIAVADPAESAAVIRRILAGDAGPARNMAVLNAAAGLITVGEEEDPKAAASRAAEAIDSGKARQLLDDLAILSHAPAT